MTWQLQCDKHAYILCSQKSFASGILINSVVNWWIRPDDWILDERFWTCVELVSTTNGRSLLTTFLMFQKMCLIWKWNLFTSESWLDKWLCNIITFFVVSQMNTFYLFCCKIIMENLSEYSMLMSDKGTSSRDMNCHINVFE